MDPKTRAFYAANAARYVAGEDRPPSAQLKRFLARLPAGATILELGAGSGRDAAYMIGQGFAVEPTDASPELAAEAERRIGRPVTILRFDQLEAVSVFDGVWASASLLHAPVAELTDDLARIHRALRPGGVFVASFKAGTGEGRDGFGRLYNYPNREGLRAHYQAAASWAELEIEQHAGSGYDRLPTEWLWVTAVRRAG